MTEIYDEIGHGYAGVRRPDTRIAARVAAALGLSRTVVNIGAGTGSYEPVDRWLLPVEPSAVMRAQRPPHLAPAIDGVAERLPLDDGAVDAAMAIITLQHWPHPVLGLREMRRVARGPVIVLTFDVAVARDWWLLSEYLPEVQADDAARFLAVGEIADTLGGAAVETVPIPDDCTDGFFHAYFTRPEAYLDRNVRRAQSAWSRLRPGVEQRAVSALRNDPASGAWDKRHGALRDLAEYDAGLRLIIG
jgi:Methyltransferase domain